MVLHLEMSTVQAREGATGIMKPEKVIEIAWEKYQDRLIIGTAFGITGMVILDIVAQMEFPIRVFTIDTGLLFPETYNVIRHAREKYSDLQIDIILPNGSPLDKTGQPLYETSPDECCQRLKIEPARKVLASYDAWIVGLRSDQGKSREDVAQFQDDCVFGIEKIAPLAEWTVTDCWNYVHRNGVPYNALHDRGYDSVGCWPCTKPAKGREGRWPGLAKIECGLHK